MVGERQGGGTGREAPAVEYDDGALTGQCRHHRIDEDIRCYGQGRRHDGHWGLVAGDPPQRAGQDHGSSENHQEKDRSQLSYGPRASGSRWLRSMREIQREAAVRVVRSGQHPWRTRTWWQADLHLLIAPVPQGMPALLWVGEEHRNCFRRMQSLDHVSQVDVHISLRMGRSRTALHEAVPIAI
jgi:hypothetical protein